MVAGARTFSLEETFLSPQILNPPPTRHALLAFLLALTAVLHIGTASWGDLYDGVESQSAAVGREMLASGEWLVPKNNGAPLRQMPPFTGWTVAASCKIFGVNATAARMPMAFAMIGLVALTFLLGERLAGYWRGFGAGLVLLCSSGAFVLGRIVAPGPLFALFICGGIYCLVRGYQHRKFRRWWFAGFWFCASLATLTKGLGAILILALVGSTLAIFFREARLRFQPLFYWPNFLLFVAIVAPWFLWASRHGLPLVFWSGAGSLLSRWRFFLLHLAWWFPGLFLILPGLILRPRKILRSDEITLTDRLPVCWLLVGLSLDLLFADRPAAAIAVVPPFALIAASAWPRMSRPLRALGIVAALFGGAAVAALIWFQPAAASGRLPPALNDAAWVALRPLAQVAIAAFVIGAFVALAILKQRGEITLVVALATMVPVGWCLIEGRARVAPCFSLAEAAGYLNGRLSRNAEVVYEGSIESGSSLAFYLDKKFFVVNQRPPPLSPDADTQRRYLDEHHLLDAWDRSDPIYLIIDESRVAPWRQLITDRVHIYHQVITSGSRVVLSNQL